MVKMGIFNALAIFL